MQWTVTPRRRLARRKLVRPIRVMASTSASSVVATMYWRTVSVFICSSNTVSLQSPYPHCITKDRHPRPAVNRAELHTRCVLLEAGLAARGRTVTSGKVLSGITRKRPLPPPSYSLTIVTSHLSTRRDNEGAIRTERVPLMSLRSTALPYLPVGAPRRRVALAVDVVTGPLSFLVLWFGTTALVNAVHTNDWWSGTIVGSAPTALWFAVVLALAWRGQTIGQALAGLRWVARDGRPARWRVVGELQFWCAGLALTLMGGPLLLMFAWSGLIWAVAGIAHVGLGIPTAWGNGVAPGLVASAVMVVALMWLARRRPAYVVRLSQ